MTTFVIGDSHTRMFSQLSDVAIIKLDPVPTMFNSHNPKSKSDFYNKVMYLSQAMDKYKDRLILVCGEVDARIHIYHKHVTMPVMCIGTSIGWYIDQTIARYGKLLAELDDKGIKFLVCGIPPAGKQCNFYQVPNYADDNARAEIYKMFHKQLRQFCYNSGYNMIDVYTPFSDSKGFIKEKYIEDEVHLNVRFQAIPW